MSSNSYNSRELGLNYFDSEISDLHPAFRPDDLRSYAEIVSFWDEKEPEPVLEFPRARIYNPTLINRRKAQSSYVVAESNCDKPSVYQVEVAKSQLRFKKIRPLPLPSLPKLIDWYCKKFPDANKFFWRFKKIITKFNIKKFIKKNKGQPYTKKTFHRMAIVRAWERLSPSYRPREQRYEPIAGGFIYNQLFKNVKKLGFDFKPKIKKQKKKEKISNKRRSPFFKKKIHFMDTDEMVLRMYHILYFERSSPILPMEKKKKDLVKIRHFRYLYAKMLIRKRTPAKLGVNLNNVYKAKDLYSKHYLNPKIYATTTDPKWRQWVKENCPNAVCNGSKIEYEMDTAHSEGVSAVQCKKSGNVIFMDETSTSSGSSPKRLTTKMNSVSHADIGYSMSHASERELVIDTFDWDDRASQSFLKSYCFPAAILDKLSKSPNSVPFQMSTFYNGDFDINIRVNSNKFQVGMLQCSWLYDPNADKNVKYRQNIFTLSQTNHCLINAGGSNVGTVHVPYISTYTALPTVTNISNNQCLNLGTLYIYVLNKLNCPDSVAKKCTVAVSIVLKNSMFYGQKPLDAGKFVYPEMEIAGEVLAVAAAEKLLTTVRGDNRDNPPYQGSSTKMVPHSNQSFCLADQLVEPVNSLRLDARGQHLPQVSGVDEMSISYVKDIYGLVHTFQWSTDHKTGDTLKTWDASPILMTSEYNGFKIKSDNFFCIPPIAVLSSMFAYWSGELKFRFDFVTTQFHTGRVMVVYVPFLTSKITFEQAKSYPYEVWDLREHQQFVFNVPYISNMPCYKRRIGFTSMLDMFVPPGQLYMFVLTGLVAMENISKQIDVNVYMAGGETFEVQIPAQPSVATCFYATDDTPSKLVRAVEGSYPWYFGNDSQFEDPTGTEHVIIRYSAYWNDISFFSNLLEWKYYKMTKDSAKTNENIKVQFNEGTYFIKDLYYVPVKIDDGTGNTHLAACASQLQAQNYWRNGWMGNGRKECLTIANLTTSPDCIGNPIFDEFSVTPTADESSSSEFEEVQHEMGERQVGNSIEQETSECRVYGLDSMMGNGIFGERFTSLKTLCRRYQPYGLAVVKGTSTYGDVLFSMPAIPHGLDLYLADSKILPTLKRVREGIIPVVLSAYRFFSGGLRFNLISSTQKKNIWIQHRPDYEGLAKIIYPGSNKNIESLVNSGYAMYLQSTSVNNVINFEVPYYKNRPLIYLQKPAEKSSQLEGATHLGQIYVGAEGGKSDEDFNCGIMYSLADDAHAHVFQGFPPMLFLDTVQNPTAISGVRGTHWEMPLLSTSHKVELPSEATKMMDSVSTLVNNLDSKISGFSDKIDTVKETMKETLMDLLGHLGHVLINPTGKQISWSIVHMLLRFGLVNKFDVHKLMDPINNMAGFMTASTPVADTPTEPEYFRGIGITTFAKKNIDDLIQHESPYFEGVKTDVSTYTAILPTVFGFVGSLICCIASVLSMKAPPKDSGGLFHIISSLTHRVATCARDLKSLGDFFSGLIESFYKILEYIGLYNNPNKIFEHFMSEELPLINDWFVEAKYLCDPVREVHVFAKDSALSDRLEECYAMGVTIASHFINLQQHNDEKKRQSLVPHFAIFKDTFAEVSSRRNDMLSRGISSLSRREPFCVYISGPPGVGKSQMAQSMIPRLLNDQGIIYVGEPIYTLMCGADYWNGCKQQPCILIDDWLSVDSGTLKENDLKAYTTLKSCAILNPPQAALPDKKMRYAPELMVVLSNKSFPEPIGVDHDMLWRRRDVLLECRMREALVGYKNMTDNKEHLHKKIKELGYDTRSPKFEHLEFRIANEPSQIKTRWSINTTGQWYSYQEVLEIINKQFTIHRNWQMECFNERREEYERNLINETNNFTPSLKERQDEFKRACKFLSTYIAKDSARDLNIFKLAADYAKRGYIAEKEREKIVLAGRDSLLSKLDKERDHIKKCIAGEELFVNYECNNFPCNVGECPTKFKDIIEAFSLVVKDKDALAKLPIKDEDIQATILGFRNLCDYVYSTVKEEEKLLEIKDWHSIYKTLETPAAYNCTTSVPKMPVTAESILIYLVLNRIHQYKLKLGEFKCKKTKDNMVHIQFQFLTKTYTLRFKMDEKKEKDTVSINFNLEDIIVDCGKNLGQCKHKECYLIMDYGLLFSKAIPGFICKCYTFDSTFIYDKEKKLFRKEGVELNLNSCLDPLCYQKTKFWAARVWSWKKANPTLVKLRECPENFCHFTDKIVLFIEGVKNYFKDHYPCIYNFFDNYVSPFFKKIFSIIKALLPYVIGIGALGALLHYLGYSDKIMSRAVALKSTVSGFYSKKPAESIPKDPQEMTIEDFEDLQLEQVTEPTMDVIAEETLHELIHSGDNVKPKRFNRHKVGVKPTVRKVTRLESGLFINEAYTALRERIKNNTFFMKSPVGDSLRILLIHEQKFIFLKHYWEALNSKFSMEGWRLINSVTRNEYSISPHLWKFDFEDNSQIGFVNIKEIPPQRSLLKTFLKDTKAHKQGVGQCMIISPDIGGCQQIVVFPKLEKSVDIASRGDMTAQKLCDIYSYNWSAPGNCCSLLIDPSRNPCVLGVHVAGNGFTGYAECLTKDQFAPWLPDHIEREDEFCDEVLLPGEVDDQLQGEFVPIGKINHQLAHNESGESQIQPSLVAGKIFPVSTDISPLSNHDPRMPQGYSPMFAGVNNMFKPPLIFDQSDVDEAEKYFENELLALCKPVTSVTRKRTLIEIVDGIPGLKYFDGLVMNTSEGFPFSSYRPNSASNKSWLFKRSGNPIQTDAVHQDLIKVLESDHNKRVRGFAVNTVFIDCLKDQRVAIDKVLTPGKTRIFSISPVQYSIAFKENFLDFLAAFKTHRLKLEHAIGISPDGPEWGEMAKVVNQHFKSYGKVFENTDEGYYFSGDYKNFGPSLSSQIVQSVNNIIMAWCRHYYEDNNEDDDRVRRCLLYERTFSYHLCFDNLYQPICGAPSGGPDTVELNTMVNKFYIYLALKHIINHEFQKNLDIEINFRFQPDMFKNLIHMISYGDDVFFKIHKNLVKDFNNVSLSFFFSKYRIGYTDATKSDTFDSFKTQLSEISFLKRGFIPHPKWRGEYLAPLDENVSVKDVCNWIHKSSFNTKLEATILSIEGCGANAYSLGPQKHREIRSKLQAALIELGCDTYLRTWDNWDEIHFAPYYFSTKKL